VPDPGMADSDVRVVEVEARAGRHCWLGEAGVLVGACAGVKGQFPGPSDVQVRCYTVVSRGR